MPRRRTDSHSSRDRSRVLISRKAVRPGRLVDGAVVIDMAILSEKEKPDHLARALCHWKEDLANQRDGLHQSIVLEVGTGAEPG
jgi:hypothetical protein